MDILKSLVIDPVLEEGRADNTVKVQVKKSENSIVIRSERGTYTFHITSRTVNRELGLKVAHLRGNTNGDGEIRLVGEVAIHPDWLTKDAVQDPAHLERVQGLVRSAARGDEHWHPHIKHPEEAPGFFMPSLLQRKSLKEIEAQRKRHRRRLKDGKRHMPPRTLLVLPPGLGKTIISMMDANKFFGGKLENPRIPEEGMIIVTVDDTDILRHNFLGSMAPYFGLQSNEIAIRYGSNKTPVTKNTKLVLVTRQSFVRESSEILAVAKKKKKGTYIIIDEAHNAGLRFQDESGEYQQIVSEINHHLGSGRNQRDFILFLTATPWHNSSDMILEPTLIDKSVVAPLLTPRELQELRDGVDVERLGATMMLRAMYHGHASPWNFIRTGTVINASGDNQLFPRVRDEGTTAVVVNTRLVDQIARDTVSQRVSGLPTRGIVFTRGIGKIEALAPELEAAVRRLERSQDIKPGTAVRTYHNDGGTVTDGVEWLSDRSAKEGRIVAVDRKFGAGTDVQAINLIIWVRETDLSDRHGVRGAIQALSRAARPSPGKVAFRVLDYSGRLGQLENLPRHLEQRQAPVPGEQTNEGRQKTVVVEDVPASFIVQDREVVGSQTTVESALTRLESAYGSEDADLILIEAAPFANRALAEGIIPVMERLKQIGTDPEAAGRMSSRFPWGKPLAQVMYSAIDHYNHANEYADNVRLGMWGLRNESDTKTEQKSWLQEVEINEHETADAWNRLAGDLNQLDPHRTSRVQMTFRPSSESRTGPVAAIEMKRFFVSALRTLADEGKIRINKITDTSQKSGPQTIVLEGEYLFSLLASESSSQHSVYRTERADKTQTREIQIVVEPLDEPSYPFNGQGLIRPRGDVTNGVTLDIAQGQFRLPDGSRGQITTRNRSGAHDIKINNPQHLGPFEQRLRMSQEHYLLMLLNNTVQPNLSRIRVSPQK